MGRYLVIAIRVITFSVIAVFWALGFNEAFPNVGIVGAVLGGLLFGTSLGLFVMFNQD